uniref:Putative tail fiber protein gp53-like C-terminal domain-containing protein n=1 Tax=mine drainage metagenome TaxID=410659 RepID=E6QP78_9ZZZZ
MSLVTIPFVFQPNTTIASSQVNQNFAALANYINGGTGVFAANGYVVLPGGIYLQWGTLAGVAADGSAQATVTFPVAFPTSAFQVVPAIDNAYQANPWALGAPQTTALGLTSFAVNVEGGPAASTVTIRYFAIGN